MKILRAPTAPFNEAYWRCKPLNLDLGQARSGTHDVYSIDLPLVAGSQDNTFVDAASSLFRYDVFPPRRMTARVCTPDRQVTIGALIIQRMLLGPLVLEMAVRIVEVLNDSNGFRRVGFSYATVEGHSERGIATFSVLARPDSPVLFEIESWSSPGNILSVLGRPFARLAQRTFTREALLHFRYSFGRG